MEKIKQDKWKYIYAGIALVIGILSFFLLGNKLSSPETYQGLFNILDEKRGAVLGLTAGTSAASVAISALPNDIGTPIANQLADLSKYLLIVLTAIYLEKYLLTVIGLIVFKGIIPVACILYIIYLFIPHNYSIKRLATKLLLFGICLSLLVPASVGISNMIDKTYEASINEVMQETSNDVVIEEEAPDKNDDLKWYEKIYSVFEDAVENVKGTTSEMAAKLKNVLNNFVEATSVMLVTSCVIPILTVLVFIWLMKIILEVEIRNPYYVEMKEKLLPHKKDNKNS